MKSLSKGFPLARLPEGPDPCFPRRERSEDTDLILDELKDCLRPTAPLAVLRLLPRTDWDAVSRRAGWAGEFFGNVTQV